MPRHPCGRASRGWLGRPADARFYFTAAESGADSSLRGLTLDGKVRLVLSGTGRFVLHDTAPDGRVLLEHATLRSEIVFRREPSGEDRDLSWFDFSAVVGISPNGDTAAVLRERRGRRSGLHHVSCGETDGSPPVRLGSGRALDLSPDGRYVMSVDIRNPSALDFTPTGPGEIRHVRVPGITAHEDAGFLADGTRIFVTGRDASGKRTTWLTDIQGNGARPLPLPDGRILRVNTFSQDGSRFVAPCPEGSYGSCFYDTLAGKPVPVPGAQKDLVRSRHRHEGSALLSRRGERRAGLAAATRSADRHGDEARRARSDGDRAGVFGVLGRQDRRRRRSLGLHVPAPPLRPAHRQRLEVARVQRDKRARPRNRPRPAA